MKDNNQKDKYTKSSDMPNDSEASGSNELSHELEKILRERDEYLNGWKRSKADLINYKKEELKRLEDMAKYATEDIMKDLIAVLDSFDLALVSLKSVGNGADKGVQMIKNQLEDVLKKNGLMKINASPGEEFDPARQEAVSVVDGGESGKISEEVEPGYMLYNKTLRPIRVKIFK
jgi:molecular chaperone GrpE